jgi:hypothetical protein
LTRPERGVEVGLIGLDFAEADGPPFSECREAAEEFGLHVAHFLDQAVFHRGEVLLEVLSERLLENE